jgi:hypothetical protein
MAAAESSFRGSPVIGYVRSAVQGDALLDEFVEQIQRYAVDNGLHLADVVRDEGTSAVAAWRPMFDRLVSDLGRSRYAGVIIPSLNQLGRPRAAALRNLARLRATSAWVAFLDDEGVPDAERG